MLLGASAKVDAVNTHRETPMQKAIQCSHSECAELLLDAGAKLSNLCDPIPRWMTSLVSRRQRCKACVRAVYGVLRKRWKTAASGMRVPRDIINMLTRMVWDRRFEAQWAGMISETALM